MVLLSVSCCILLCLWTFCLCGDALEFSGFYTPPIERGVNASGAEDFAAAWLVTRSRLFSTLKILKANEKFSMASATFTVVRSKCKGCQSLMTRDYFDYMVEHMSATSNRIPHGSKLIYNITSTRVRATSQALKNLPTRSNEDKRSQVTLGVLVFSSVAFSAFTTPEQAGIRVDFFEATFYSVYRYFNRIDIFVATESDANLIRSIHLPYRKLIVIPATADDKKRNPSLVNKALQLVISEGDSEDWSWVKYIYFTEGDQVLHLRTIPEVFDMIDAGEGLFAMVPHRMQTYPLRTTYPKNTQRLFDTQKRSGQTNLPSNLEVVVENLEELKGSCCDAGRNVYEPSTQGGWWYTVAGWGLANFTQWFRVGKTGLTFLPSTEHKGVCSYSEEKRLCEMPVGCTERIPIKGIKLITDIKGRQRRSSEEMFDPCKQIPTVNFIVNYTAQMEREREAIRLSQVTGQLSLK